MPPTITYTTITEVQRVLRTNVQKRVNFSGHYRNLGGEVDNTSAITLNAVAFYDDYARIENIELVFTDTTSYKVTFIDDSVGVRGSVSLGNATIYSDYTTSHGFVIGHDDWVGIAFTGDKVKFQTEVHMSKDDVYNYMSDAEIWVDSVLKEKIYQDTTTVLNTLLFDSTSVPVEVKFATTRLTAYLIFNDVFQANIEGMQTTDPRILGLYPVINWHQQAMSMLKRYIEIYVGQKIESGPRWISHERLFPSVGVKGIGRGVARPKKDVDPSVLYDDEFRDLGEPEENIDSEDEIS